MMRKDEEGNERDEDGHENDDDEYDDEDIADEDENESYDGYPPESTTVGKRHAIHTIDGQGIIFKRFFDLFLRLMKRDSPDENLSRSKRELLLRQAVGVAASLRRGLL